MLRARTTKENVVAWKKKNTKRNPAAAASVTLCMTDLLNRAFDIRHRLRRFQEFLYAQELSIQRQLSLFLELVFVKYSTLI